MLDLKGNEIQPGDKVVYIEKEYGYRNIKRTRLATITVARVTSNSLTFLRNGKEINIRPAENNCLVIKAASKKKTKNEQKNI